MNLYFKEYGDPEGSSIVFIHGGGMTGEVWNNTLPWFKDYHCIVVDLPEHGKSSHIVPFTMSDSARHIAAVIQKQSNNGKAHIVGHSLGGMVGIKLLGDYSNLIDHAVIASGNLRPSFVYSILSNSLVCGLTSAILRKNNEKDFISKGMLQRMYQNVKENLFIPDGLEHVEVPTLLIAGSKEHAFLKNSNLDLLKILPHSKAILMDGARHDYPWTERNSFNNVIQLWIRDREIIDPKVRNVEQ